jgi:shikimate kinase
MKCAAEFPNLNFVGSHPMAGTEKSSWRSAVKGLYENADILIIPGKYSTAEGIKTIKTFWRTLNTHLKEIDSDSHDALVAKSSHMLHIIASALTRSILDQNDANEQRRYYSGCATGFRDTSRIASSSPNMWQEICISNAKAIVPALDEFQHHLEEMKESLIKNDGEKFAKLFTLGRDLRNSWLCYKKSHNLPQNIVLCGIKHSGKTTVGKEIAAILNINFVDTDDLVVAKDGNKRTVREIFSIEGEAFFRKLEADVITDLANSNQRVVIALGGGTLSNPFIDNQIKEKLGFKVWLDTDDHIAFTRIIKKGLPPFLQNTQNPELAFKEMNIDRKKIFAAQCEVHCLPAETPHYTALHILSLFKDKWF